MITGQACFKAFFADVGERPSPLHSLDRINVNGNYEPGNCRWATKAEQRQNQRRSLSIDVVNEVRGRHEHGESQTSIARRMSLTSTTVGDLVNRHTWKDVP